MHGNFCDIRDIEKAGRSDRPGRIVLHLQSGGGGRTRTYEGIASGFTVRPLCRSGHSPEPVEPVCETAAKIPVRARISRLAFMRSASPGVNPERCGEPLPPAQAAE